MLHAIVITGWIAFFWWLVRGPGDDALLGRFVRGDYWWLIYIAIGIFVALAVSVAVSPPPWLGSDRFRRSVIQAVILSLPILYLPLGVTSELSIEAAEKRSLYTPRVGAKQSESSKPIAGTSNLRQETDKKSSLHASRVTVKQSDSPKQTQVERTAKRPIGNPTGAIPSAKPHEPTLLDLVSDPEAFEGSNATLVGMVYKDKRLPSDSFFCYRLLMICCAADASPVGLIVRWPEASKLNKGDWVKVSGKVGLTTFEGEDYPEISAAAVEKIGPPKNRFILAQ